MTRVYWLDAVLATTVVLRGLGAGIIAGVLAITVPTRHQMFKLWKTSDEDPALIARLLDRFTRAGTFSAIWHAIAFMLIVAALAVA